MNLFAWLVYRKPFIFSRSSPEDRDRFLENVNDGIIKSVAEIAVQLNYVASIEEVDYDDNHYFMIQDGVAIETHAVSIVRYGMPGMSMFNMIWVLGTRAEHCDHIKNIIDQVNKEQYDMQVAAQARAQLAGVLRR